MQLVEDDAAETGEEAGAVLVAEQQGELFGRGHQDVGREAALPRAALSRISFGRADDATVVARAHAPGEWNATGRSMIWLDPYTPRVLAVRDASAGDTAARIDGMIYPLHAGTVGGWAYRGVVIACGVLPAFFVTTGFLFWRARTRRRR